MALTKYQMTFQFADNSAFSSGVWEIEIDILGADVIDEDEIEELKAWDLHKETAVEQRLVIAVDLYPPSVLESEQDHGHYRMLMQAFREKPYKRIKTTNLERVGRHFDPADGSMVGPYNLWTDETHGLCKDGGLPVQYNGTSKAKYSDGKQVTTINLFQEDVL